MAQPPQRTLEQLREQYEVEKELAERLRIASRPARRTLYATVYDELFRRVPHHPQLTRRPDAAQQRRVAAQLRLLEPYLKPDSVFLEVGAGDCALALKAAELVAQVYALEVSAELTGRLSPPANFRLLLSDGCAIDLPEATVDIAYSYQLMEHVHPDDAFDQLREIYRVLKPGGTYFCVTPNRLSGPHDISRYFDRIPSGLHLREYSIGDLVRLYRQVGFQRFSVHRVLKSRHLSLPAPPFVVFERLLDALPWPIRSRVARSRLGSRLLDASVAGRKTR